VTATALCPGPVQTEFAEAAGTTDEEASASLPRIMWVSSEAVAKAAVDGLDHDRAVVIPGAVNRVAAIGAQHLPRSLLLPFLARQHPSLRP
jgi:short-subunit dehydrogenase